MIIAKNPFLEQHDIAKTLRFEKELENVFFIVLDENKSDEPNKS